MPHIVSRIVQVFPFRFNNDTMEYLLLRRSPNDPLYPGVWQIVTGTLHEGEHAVAGAKRELMEETGVAPLHFWILPQVSSFYDAASDELQFSPLFACQFPGDADPILSAEHTAYVWCPRSAAIPLLVWPGQRQALQIVHEFIVSGEPADRLSELA